MPDTVDPQAAATDIVALWEGLQLQAPLSADPVSVSEHLAAMFASLAGHPIEPVFLPG